MIEAGTTVVPAPARVADECRQLGRWRRRPEQFWGSSVQQTFSAIEFPGVLRWLMLVWLVARCSFKRGHVSLNQSKH